MTTASLKVGSGKSSGGCAISLPRGSGLVGGPVHEILKDGALFQGGSWLCGLCKRFSQVREKVEALCKEPGDFHVSAIDLDGIAWVSRNG